MVAVRSHESRQEVVKVSSLVSRLRSRKGLVKGVALEDRLVIHIEHSSDNNPPKQPTRPKYFRHSHPWQGEYFAEVGSPQRRLCTTAPSIELSVS